MKMLSRSVGVMQGRLLPPRNGRIQSFPGDGWAAEFHAAATIGLSSIEWIVESPLESNPMLGPETVKLILDAIQGTGVTIDFVCADFYMEQPWVRASRLTRDANRKLLIAMLAAGQRLGIKGIEIPCVDASELRSVQEEDELLKGIEPCLDAAHAAGIAIGLETSLSPDRFRQLLIRASHPALKANYDSGNSASLGFDTREEIASYGQWVNNVHIKDRQLRGTTVPLGTGDANIPATLASLRSCGYSGDFILQAARQLGDEASVISGYAAQLRAWIDGANVAS